MPLHVPTPREMRDTLFGAHIPAGAIAFGLSLGLRWLGLPREPTASVGLYTFVMVGAVFEGRVMRLRRSARDWALMLALAIGAAIGAWFTSGAHE
jgi:hypothetical protein